MYILYIMLLANLAADIELEKGPFDTIDDCWAEAEQVSRGSEVFSVRCTLVEEK